MTETPRFDLLVVGAGLFGSVVAREALDRGMSVLVLERRGHIGGNCYTKQMEGINVHAYGAHIFRTDDEVVWNYMRRFCRFNNFVNSPIANFNGELYNLPFNMNTFHELWGVATPAEAKRKINEQRVVCESPSNLEEHVLNLVGRDIYEKLVKGYTEKQWGVPCKELPASIMRRIPLRFTYDNNYFNAFYQGIPIGGYTHIFEQLLDGATVLTGTDFLLNRAEWMAQAHKTVYTGPIDEFFDFEKGPLGYRGLRFEHMVLEEENHQGVAVMNYTDADTPYTRTIEHKHFEYAVSTKTVISREYPAAWSPGEEPYYPMEDQANRDRYARYSDLAKTFPNVLFGGRLGEYRYYDMQDTVKSALLAFKQLFAKGGGER